jgi:trigger factor
VAAVLARHDFSVPDAMVMRHVAHQVEHARERMRRQGIDPDRLPWDYEKLIPELRPESEKAVKRALLLEAIAEQEQINPDDAEVDTEIERFAQASQRPVPAVRRMMEKSGDLDGLRGGLREKKTLDFLIKHAKVSA